MENSIGMLENFIRQSSFKSIFTSRKSGDEASTSSPKPISLLSSIANSVVARCSKILLTPTEELQHQFETELPNHAKQSSSYARNLLEFCSYRALCVVIQSEDYLSDKEFRHLSFDMMLAWEAPGRKNEPLIKETALSNKQDNEDEGGWSLFYSDTISMAVQVDNKKTVGPEAFARIAPACPAVADIITVRNLFDALTSSSDGQLHYLVYDKYLSSLVKVIKTAKLAFRPPLNYNLPLTDGEMILDIDGTVPTQPILQHTGISAWPGRLTLTNYALYFESLGVGLYDKAVRYDLRLDLKQVVKPEMTGPLGARLFDKAVMYKSTSVAEPVYLEFPEFKSSSRRDYWLEITLEILRVHRFIRKYNLKNIQEGEALARAILGIFRSRAVREAFHIFPSRYKTLLVFNLAENLPGGDMILEVLANRLELLNANTIHPNVSRTVPNDIKLCPVSLLALMRVGFSLLGGESVDEQAAFMVGDVCAGEVNSLEMAVKQLKSNTGRAEAAQATVDQVKMEGIDTNVAVMKELLFPVLESVKRLQYLASWEDPFKSFIFLMAVCYAIRRGWIKYLLPSIFVFLATLMLWRKHFNHGKPLKAFRVTSPPNRNAVEQLLTLQEAVFQFETLVQTGNVILLKLRALLLGALPQATDKVSFFLIAVAAAIAFLSFEYLITLIFLEAFTREMPLRKNCNDRWLRRLREWWVRIPAAPVELIKAEDNKKRK